MTKILLLCVVLSGCIVDTPHGTMLADGAIHIVADGDSNTKFGCNNPSLTWPHCQESALSWVDYLFTLDTTAPLVTLPANEPRAFFNEALGGSTACSQNLATPADDFDAAKHVPHIIADVPDVAILAYGTNDLAAGFTPCQIVECYRSLYQTLNAAGAIVFIALTPPEPGRVGVTEALVEDLNTQLVAAFGTRQTIDFFTGVTSDSLQADGVHVTDAEQQRRAQIVYDALAAWPHR